MLSALTVFVWLFARFFKVMMVEEKSQNTGNSREYEM